ncbi:GNAT family N-acetyltransferase [Kangiella sediminilitoris]|uniref:GCN5-related N-acetyltransferase n=1 Tax=Kangiella sediminilitoris TaxID=1144748 RepID=A0A1B3BC96_9GAMM|nr:GNAT family N-acetyltransferase [Kangiella sediminilitoris]AOE50418.1 GCN5-related N-acetyltransferase [Kangiella sediminilitoris]
MKEVIDTGRLLLRPLKESDFEDYCDYAMDPEVMKYIMPVSSKKDAHQLFLNHFGEWTGEEGRWMGAAVVLKSEPKLIGDIGFRYVNKYHEQIEIGYKFNRNYHGKGFGTEATKAMLKIIVRDWPCHKIVAYCEPRNIASWKLMEHFGMVREAYFKEHFKFDGRWQDEVAYGCLTRNLKL